MLKLYKKAIPLIGIVQLILFLIIIILGFVSYNVWSFGNREYFESFYSASLNLITIIYQFIFYASIFAPLRLLYLGKIKRIKLLASLSFFFYAILITLYIAVGVEWIFGGYFYDYTNEEGTILGIFWIVSTVVFFIPFLSNLIIIFIAPLYKNEKALKQLKSKTSKDAANKIRDLKKLLDEGIISKEVFDEKSKKYIGEL
jgi:uncharacterized membrane protein